MGPGGSASGIDTTEGGAGPANCRAIKCTNSGGIKSTKDADLISLGGIMGPGGSADNGVTNNGGAGPVNCQTAKCTNSGGIQSEKAFIISLGGIMGPGGCAYNEFTKTEGGAGPVNCRATMCSNSGGIQSIGGAIIISLGGIIGSGGNTNNRNTNEGGAGPENCLATKCSNSGGIQIQSGDTDIISLGGIIGGMTTDTSADGTYKCKVSESHNMGNIQIKSGAPINTIRFGGIYGFHTSGTNKSIAKCSYNTGSIENEGTIGVIYYGGIFSSDTYECFATLCYNQGSSVKATNASYFGGIFGRNNTKATVSNCYNTGPLLDTKFYGILCENINAYKYEYNSQIVNCYVISHPIAPSDPSIQIINSSTSSESNGSWYNKYANKYLLSGAKNAWVKLSGEHSHYYLSCFLDHFYKPSKPQDKPDGTIRIKNLGGLLGTYYVGTHPLNHHKSKIHMNPTNGNIKFKQSEISKHKLIIIHISLDLSYQIDMMKID